jgi:hypothetical protein
MPSASTTCRMLIRLICAQLLIEISFIAVTDQISLPFPRGPVALRTRCTRMGRGGGLTPFTSSRPSMPDRCNHRVAADVMLLCRPHHHAADFFPRKR